MRGRQIEWTQLAGPIALLVLSVLHGGDATAAGGPLRWHVQMRTDNWAGEHVFVAMVLRTTDSGAPANYVTIRNFTHNGVIGPIETLGGQVSGDLVARFNPAVATTINNVNGWLNGAEGVIFPETHLMVNFAYTIPGVGTEAKLGTRIDFDVEVVETPIGTADFPHEFACYLLDANHEPVFPSGEPLGSDALFTLSSGNWYPGWELGYYSPTQLRAGQGQNPDTLLVDFNGISPPGGGGGGDDPPIVQHAPSWLSAGPNPTSVPIVLRFARSSATRCELNIYDVRGRRIRQFGESQPAGGEKSLVWALDDESGRRVPAGVYFVEVRNQGGGAIRKLVVLDH